MNMLQEKLDFLLKKYSVNAEVTIDDFDTAVINGVKMRLLPWRSERRFFEMKKLVSDKVLKGISTMRITHLSEKNTDLYLLLFREADICQWILGSKIKEIFVMENRGAALNAIAKTESGIICTFELSASLPNQSKDIDKHEIISASGIACDRVVDTQTPQSSVYVYSEKPGVTADYTDTDAELFGLSVKECASVRNCFELAKTGENTVSQVNQLENVILAAKKSAAMLENIILKEAE